ncbi:MAG: UDP-N-acetylmuramoyl-tripeptide--D-alanyl-D-alanine ligase [Solobacterium sp.]|nr:UDP-N-acetylmuramoyl-tripeptide--D-alanyl-D-alanine ligase [Solobacterium sp.]
MKIVYYIIILIAALVPAKHALHMFQQNRYELERYTAWVSENIEGGAKRAAIPALIITAVAFACMRLSVENVLIFCTCIAALLSVILILRERKAVYIKPLVYSDRVKRQILVMTILYLLIQFYLLYRFRRFNLWAMLALSYFGPWLLIYPMAVITAPVEKRVNEGFVNDAKRILNEHDDLIKIGITGSYGKTTTKNIMGAILSEQYNTLITPASYNTPMGITRTIREMLKPIHRVFVCEMGADHVGDITYLMNFVKPTIGAVTSIGPQHLSTFGSQENITKEKMQMIECLPEDGFGILNADNDLIREYPIQSKVKTVTYALHHEADYTAENITYSIHGMKFTVVNNDTRVEFETRLLGELNVLNILCAIAAARRLNISWETIQRGVKDMKQVEHRLEQRKINGRMFIDDAFNSNPSGAAMALDVLAMMPGKRVIVTPGMIELGDQQESINREFGASMKGKADEVILVGSHQTESIYEGLRLSGFDMDHVTTVDRVREAFDIVYQITTGEDTILLENDLPDAFNR